MDIFKTFTQSCQIISSNVSRFPPLLNSPLLKGWKSAPEVQLTEFYSDTQDKKHLTADKQQDILISKSEPFQIMKVHKATILRKLKECGLKLTTQRLAIIETLTENTSLHPGASLIYQKAKKKVKGLSLSTVYYTLNELSKHGIIKMLEFDKMENRYEGNISHHLNLVCVGCGSILDFPKALPISPEKVEGQMGFRPYEMRFEYYGYCKECLARKK